ncbi:histidine phosphatase family protein [Methylobacterium dankookense]|uniref:Histidine phosphatase family protein n=1 Tax=Methylobacterium dankookense TaxID=560405 RepID=A0A564G0M8_9HYPH|nr:histidine phosphatase family protein [Methylobacterium dankookense]GJD54578.1 hypothetical protein IFDJLNFL_0452 [Methylobacterium dankookense]VUF13490.1 hypothetical protein MTDSW087_03193 [Methylobacterium dankookense]
MSALTVLLLRHAEKPGGDYPGVGRTFEGKRDDKSLIVRGWQRAGAWAALLGSGLSADYPLPTIIYAARPEPVTAEASFSHRPWETALPLARRLYLDVNTRWGVGQEQALVEELTKLTGTVAIFWEHKAIPTQIIPALLGSQSIPGVPAKWDSDRFDVVLRFDRATPDAPWSYRQLSPRLLDGDSDKPFAELRTL